MHTSHYNRGFMKFIIFFALAIGIIFLFLTFFAKYFAPSSLMNNISGSSTSSGGGLFSDTSSYAPTTNPLLNFSNYNGGSGSAYYDDGNRSKPNTDGSGRSPYSGKVTLSSGTAGNTYQTFEEYVTLDNSGPAVNITGWTLTNSKGSRPVESIQNNYVYPSPESATIGAGTEFLDPIGVYKTGPIVLQNGDMAYVVTGRPYAQYTFPISTSFRENICVGYLKNYPFNPPLANNCPLGADDPLIKTVTDQCYDYIRSLGRCEDPEKQDKQNFDNTITSQCRQFIRPRLNYAGCVDHSKSLSNFSSDIWRVFLGKDKELWAQSRETITLYDAKGLIVDQVSY